jgi:hypothetical protein
MSAPNLYVRFEPTANMSGSRLLFRTIRSAATRSKSGHFIMPLLQYFFKNGAMLVDRTPEPELLPSAFHNDFIQIPNVA